jgi:hypothetical protein
MNLEYAHIPNVDKKMSPFGRVVMEIVNFSFCYVTFGLPSIYWKDLFSGMIFHSKYDSISIGLKNQELNMRFYTTPFFIIRMDIMPF